MAPPHRLRNADPTRQSGRARLWLAGAGLCVAIALGIAAPWWLVEADASGTGQQVAQWVHGLHQKLRSSGARVNATVEQTASRQRVLAEDDAISAAVSDALAATQNDDLRMLQVQTGNAMVTLEGTLPSPDLRDRAIAITEGVSGVHGVFSLIQIR
ncbi:BON domain-containing protein [Comamonas odontotermitis]|uniref:BON domain-containing protein n=1 Tax=Comamonas odontotermitis TaxID=379895 RepID=UPI001CC51FAA|nr:BON domain-containing protein [Comamonas odontotermitis]UBB18698.1 BON domain-containing protein [Comamonas odontotermitis]